MFLISIINVNAENYNFHPKLDSLQIFFDIEISTPVDFQKELANVSDSINNGNLLYAITLCEQLLKIAHLENEVTNKASIYSNLGVAYWYLSDIEKGNKYTLKSIEYAKLNFDTTILVKSNFNLGFTFLSNGNYSKSLAHFLEAEKYAVNDCEQLSKVKDYISYLFIEQEKLLEAEPFIREAFHISQNCNDTVHKANMYNSLGYFLLVKDKNDSAYYYFTKAYKLSSQIGYTNGLAIATGNLTEYYLKEYKFDEAINSCLKSLDIDKDLNDIEGQAYSYFQLAQIYLKQEKFNLAIKSCDEAIDLTDKLSADNLKVDILVVKFQAQKAKKDFQNALETNILFQNLKDSIYGVEKTKDLNDIITQYETEKHKIEKIAAISDKKLAEQKAEKNRNLFLAALSCFLLLLLTSLFYIKQMNLKKRTEIAELKLSETENKLLLERKYRTAELKALKSQMNPHFLFNAFNSIQEFIILNKKEVASEYLGKFSDLMRLYLEQSRNSEIALEEELRSLSLYLELEKVRFGDSFDFDINVEKNLDKFSTHVPPLIIQPFVENSLKHGLLHKKLDRKLWVEFTSENNILICKIIDNGIGRRQSALLNKNRIKTHKSFAISSIESRIALLNINREKDITLAINDLYDKEDNALGTEVILTIPL